MKKIAIIGGGNMGAAILGGIKGRYSVIVCEKDATKVKFLQKKYRVKIADLREAVGQSDIILLAVKPQDFEQVLAEIKADLISSKLVISIAAGITTKYIEKKLGASARVIRCMPNLPLLVGQGITGICRGRRATNTDEQLAANIFKSVGEVVLVQEKWMDAVTAVSGSGPAYVFLFVECWLKAAKNLGFSDEQSKALVISTLKGSLALLEKSKDSPEVLRAKVTSKGGTTQAAMDVFARRKFDQIFTEALAAAKKRAKELAK